MLSSIVGRGLVASVRCGKHFRWKASAPQNDFTKSQISTIFPFKEQKFNSVAIDVEKLHVNDSSEFGVKLWTTISHLREEGKTACYLNIPMTLAHYIQIAGLYGFKYHHAEGDSATLLLWLLNGECKVPPFATHHCGVAGLVVDDNKILVVKERSKLVGWKLPGGYVNLGEELSAAAVREVREETGIATSFQGVVAFRHSLNVQFGRGDVYVICRLSVDGTRSITVDEEIEDARWMDLAEFRKANEHPMLRHVLELLDVGAEEFTETTMSSTLKGRGPFKLYSPPLPPQPR